MTFPVDVGSTACRSLAIFSGPAKAQLVVNKTKSASPTSRVPQATPFDRRTAVDFCFLCPWRTIKILLTSLQNKAINPKRSNVDRKSTRLNSSHGYISYAVFCLKKKKK